MDNGRDGLGCIVVFAAGNKSPAIDYPASYRPEILTVGSITSSSQRSSFSGYGNLLDIVAPGSSILSSIRNNQYESWNGTSMATPHVSAVAGLILSINPNLTRLQVTNVIESTAQKVGGYTYQTTTGRPNGTWHSEMGYGLLNAFSASMAVQPGCSGSTSYSNQNVISNTTVNGCNVNVQNVSIQNNARLIINSGNKTTISAPFTIQSGSQLEIR